MEDPRSLFAKRQLRCTQQRRDLFLALRACKSHPTAEQLHRIVNETSSPGMSLATAYNALEALCQAGLCRRLATVDGVARYDADTTDHMHVILENGSVKDVPHDLGERVMQSLPQDLLDEIESRMGVRIRNVNLQLMAQAEGSAQGETPDGRPHPAGELSIEARAIQR